MIRDVKSSYLLATTIASGLETTGDIQGASADHSMGNSASFFINVGAVTGTVDAKLQYSDDNTNWTDEDGASGNDMAIAQMTAAGSAQLNIVNPQGRYSRVLATVGGTNANMSVMSVLGPLRTIVPSDA
jgi:hypothetical protein